MCTSGNRPTIWGPTVDPEANPCPNILMNMLEAVPFTKGPDRIHAAQPPGNNLSTTAMWLDRTKHDCRSWGKSHQPRKLKGGLHLPKPVYKDWKGWLILQMHRHQGKAIHYHEQQAKQIWHHMVATSLQFVNNIVSVKCNKVQLKRVCLYWKS